MIRRRAWIALLLVLAARRADATACAESPTGQQGCDVFSARNANPNGLDNVMVVMENNSGGVTPLTQCTATESGVAGYDCCTLPHDLDTGAGEVWVETCGTSTYLLHGKAILDATSHKLLATLWEDAVGTAVAVDVYPDTTDKPDEGNAADLGSIAWAKAQFTGNTNGRVNLAAGNYEFSTTITNSGKYGGVMSGAGPYATDLIWVGNNRDPMLLLDDSNAWTIENLRLRSSPTTPCWDCIVIVNGVAVSGVTASSNRFVNVVLDGTSGTCVGGPNNGNACTNYAACCNGTPTCGGQCVTGIQHTGVLITHPQSDFCSGDGEPYWLCSAANVFRSAAGICCTTAGATSCNAADGACDRDNGVGGGGAPCPGTAGRNLCVYGVDGNNDFNVFDDVKWLNVSSNAVAMDVESSQAVGQVVMNGEAHGAWISYATGYWTFLAGTNGGSGGHYSYIKARGGSSALSENWLASSTNRPTVIEAGDFESSIGSFVMTVQSSGGSRWPLTITGNRWDGNSVKADSTCTASLTPWPCCTGSGAGNCEKNLNIINNRGPVRVTGNTLGNVATVNELWFGTNTAPMPVTIADNVIRTATTAANLTANPPIRCANATCRFFSVGNIAYDNSVNTYLPFIEPGGTRYDMTDATKQATDDLSVLATSTTAIIRPTRQACGTFYNVTGATDDEPFFRVTNAARILSLGCACKGTCTPTLATFALADQAGNAMTGSPTCVTGSTAMTYTAITDNAASQLVAGDGVRLNTTNTPNPTSDTYEVCVNYIGQ